GGDGSRSLGLGGWGAHRAARPPSCGTGGWMGGAPCPSPATHPAVPRRVTEVADDGRDHDLFHRHGLLAVTSHARDPSGRPPGARYGPGAAGTASLARATVGGPTPPSRKLPHPGGVKNAAAPP